MEAKNNTRSAQVTRPLQDGDRRSPIRPEVWPLRLPAGGFRPLALWLLVATGWNALHAHPAPAQVVRGVLPAVPTAIDLQDEPEDAPDDVVILDGADDILSLVDRSLEDLAREDVFVPAMDMEVSTVSRTTSTVGRSPAAVFVITGEMIRRTGSRNIPEVLRMVPGLQVTQLSRSEWGITSRGFNGSLANKLLVQIDGRTVYTPLDSGVVWSIRHVPLEDIERIEVVRGPGASVWGANAVNGVINIITKESQDTQGILINAGGGTEERDFGTFRYGGQIGNSLNYRVYGTYMNRGDAFSRSDVVDAFQLGRAGFRMDWDVDPCQIDRITFQGDYYDATGDNIITSPLLVPPFQQTTPNTTAMQGGNLLARWRHVFSEDSDSALQFYYDRSDQQDIIVPRQSIETYDIDFQHRFPLSWCQQIVWGLSYRSVQLDTVQSVSLGIDPPSRRTDLYSAFIQDEVTIVDDRLYLVAGCKGEHNDFTGYEFQPTGRLVWLPTDRSSAWAAISRAVRTPAFVDSNDGYLRLVASPPLPPFMHPVVRPSTNMQSEELLAYEVGYRAQPSDAFSWDLALFYNVYDRLRAFDIVTFIPPEVRIGNRMSGETYGVELSCQCEITPCWRLSGYYAFLQMQLHAAAGTGPDSETDEGKSPHNQVYLQSSWDLGCDVEFDVMTRYVDNVPTHDIPSYIALDFRLGWRPTGNLELAVIGRNLLENERPEFVREFVQSPLSGPQRSVYGMATWRY